MPHRSVSSCRLADETGSVTLLAALGILMILGALALSIDVGQLRLEKLSLQRAADAAAMAAALEAAYCGGVPGCLAMQNAARSALVENGFTPSSVITNCAAPSGTGLTLIVDSPPCALGSSDPNNGNRTVVEVSVAQAQTSLLASILGQGKSQLATRAEATPTSGGYCMFALDPSGASAFSVQALAVVNSSCGIMVESSAATALSCSLAAVRASKISVVGGVSSFGCAVAPSPNTGITLPTPSDPLAYLPAPTVPACGNSVSSPFHGASSAITLSGIAVLYADYAYCGGITIKPGARVTFSTAYGSVFALTSTNGAASRLPGGLTVDLGASVTGTGLTFYNYGPSGGITFNYAGLFSSGVQLSAPTSGTYSGILFFQPASNTAQAQLVGSSALSTVLQGAYYFPGATVTFAYSGPVAYNILVAYDISFRSLTLGLASFAATQFASDYSSLANGSPLQGFGAVLLQ